MHTVRPTNPLSNVHKITFSVCGVESKNSSDDGRLIATSVLLQLGHLHGDFDEGFEENLRVVFDFERGRRVRFDVKTDGGTRRSGATQAKDDPRSIGEDHTNALL